MKGLLAPPRVTTRVIERTETHDTFTDGTFAIIKREHIEESIPPPGSGLLEAWFGLVLLLSTGIVFGLMLRLLGFAAPLVAEPTHFILRSSPTDHVLHQGEK